MNKQQSGLVNKLRADFNDLRKEANVTGRDHSAIIGWSNKEAMAENFGGTSGGCQMELVTLLQEANEDGALSLPRPKGGSEASNLELAIRDVGVGGHE
ncbi:hypothetical protein Acr_23g0012240 [Actinidia rufa]|uniref:Uncharacterized protein n=1 Tax=Actinidia rufa TaxID=165716 RepID=A0A7J0GPW4_9ERIC|nr:hypothetical protein Acr_23g0012240 [Actinidia rufa]